MCCYAKLTATHVYFIQTAQHLSALFMTVVDWQWQFFRSFMCYVQYFSRTSAENVGSQPILSHVFLLIAIIRLSRISAEISFQPSGI